MMTNKVKTSVDQITIDWLTSVLFRRGALVNGAVSSFSIDPGQGNWSTNAKIIVKYTHGAQGSLPQRLFLKMVNADIGDDESFGCSEVAYYARDYVDIKNAPLLHCYDAAYSEKLKQYHVLLDDVSETHIVAADKEPNLAHGLALAEGLSILHARWWGAQRLAQAEAPIHNPKHIQRFVDIAKPGAKNILKDTSTELKPHWPDAIHELLEKHPQAMIERSLDDNGFTLIHGDVGENNILVPRKEIRPIYIIDRQPFNWSLTTWLGVYDLAYAIVLDWEVETRRQSEILILKRYHEHLIINGVSGYSWEQLLGDYRLCVAMGVYTATEYCRGGTNKRWFHVWLRMLKRALTACDDLDCRSIWS